MVIKRQLMAFQKDENTRKVSEKNRKFVRFNYCYNNDIQICRTTYENLIGTSHKYLDTIIQHLRENGLEERIHRNTGRAPKNMNRIEINYDIACDVYLFLKNYSNVHGLSLPGRYCNENDIPVVFLPTSFSYSSVYHNYVQAYKEKHESEARIMAESAFINTWKSLMPSLQFMSLKSDLCETCETIKMDVQYAIQYEKKLELTENYLAHLNRAQQERNYYNSNIATTIEDGKNNPNSSGSQVFKTFQGSAHIAYDWAQNVQIPYSPQQIGTLFFKSP
jgi:hypothetical protein